MILCDYCAKDLTTTRQMESYRIEVRSKRIPSDGYDDNGGGCFPEIPRCKRCSRAMVLPDGLCETCQSIAILDAPPSWRKTESKSPAPA